MSTSKILFTGLVALTLTTTACSKDWYTSHSGNMPTKERVEDVKIGMSKHEVENSIGVPSNVISMDKNTWIYMSAEMEQIAFMDQKELDRNVLVIKFDKNDHVKDIQHLTKKDGQNIKIDNDRTEVTGKEEGFFEKYFGGVGQYNPLGTSGPIQPNQ